MPQEKTKVSKLNTSFQERIKFFENNHQPNTESTPKIQKIKKARHSTVTPILPTPATKTGIIVQNQEPIYENINPKKPPRGILRSNDKSEPSKPDTSSPAIQTVDRFENIHPLFSEETASTSQSEPVYSVVAKKGKLPKFNPQNVNSSQPHNQKNEEFKESPKRKIIFFKAPVKQLKSKVRTLKFKF